MKYSKQVIGFHKYLRVKKKRKSMHRSKRVSLSFLMMLLSLLYFNINIGNLNERIANACESKE